MVSVGWDEVQADVVRPSDVEASGSVDMLRMIKCVTSSGGTFHVLGEFGKYSLSLIIVSSSDVTSVRISPLQSGGM